MSIDLYIFPTSPEYFCWLEKKYNVVFPKSYRVFLENFGRGLGGSVMNDVNAFYPKILGLTDFLRNEVLIEEGDPYLPKKAFVFAERYEEQFMFFDASGSVKEPPIFHYMVNDEEFKKVGETVFDILEKEIELSKKLKKKREKS